MEFESIGPFGLVPHSQWRASAAAHLLSGSGNYTGAGVRPHIPGQDRRLAHLLGEQPLYSNSAAGAERPVRSRFSLRSCNRLRHGAADGCRSGTIPDVSRYGAVLSIFRLREAGHSPTAVVDVQSGERGGPCVANALQL